MTIKLEKSKKGKKEKKQEDMFEATGRVTENETILMRKGQAMQI